MAEWPTSVQPLFVGATLLWSGGLKCAGPSAGRAARRSALRSLVGEERAPAVYRLTGAVELLLAAPDPRPASPGPRSGDAGRRAGQPPAMAPTIRKGSAPVVTGSGSGVSGGSWERSRSHA